MTYLDHANPNPDGSPAVRVGRIILSGGEALLDATRERVTYRVIEALAANIAMPAGCGSWCRTPATCSRP